MKQTLAVISALVLSGVGGFWLMESRLERHKLSVQTPIPTPLPHIATDATIRKHISSVQELQTHVVKQWENDEVGDIAFSPDGKLFARSTNFGIEVERVKDWKRFRLLKNVWGTFAFSHDSGLIAAQNAGVWRLSDGRLFRNLGGGTTLLGPVSFSPDDKFVATLSWPESVTTQGPSIYPRWIAKELMIWNLSTSEQPKIQAGLDSDDDGFSTIVWRNRAKGGRIPLWKAELLTGHGDSAMMRQHSISVNIVGHFIQVSDATTGEILSRVRRPSKMGPIAIAPDATLFAGADAADPFVYIWRLPDAKLLRTIKRQGAQKALALAFSSDARQLAVSFLTAPKSPNNPTKARQGSTVIYDLNRAR